MTSRRRTDARKQHRYHRSKSVEDAVAIVVSNYKDTWTAQDFGNLGWLKQAGRAATCQSALSRRSLASLSPRHASRAASRQFATLPAPATTRVSEQLTK